MPRSSSSVTSPRIGTSHASARDVSTRLLRAVDAMSLTLATVTVALVLARADGVDAYARFLSVIVVGTAVGGALSFLLFGVLRVRYAGVAGAVASGAGRLLLAAGAAHAATAGSWLWVAGLLVTAGSVSLTSMFHSLASNGGRGLAARTELLAATATGGVVGTAAAGVVVERGLYAVLLGIQVAGALIGLVVAARFLRAFPSRGEPIPVAAPDGPVAFLPTGEMAEATPPPLVAGMPPGDRPAPWWRQLGHLRPIAWRVPVITAVAFTVGSLAPGVVAETRGVGAGALAGSVYLLGAVGTALLIRAADRPPRLALSGWFADHRRWFLPAAAGVLPWLALPAPAVVALAGAALAGVLLHLVQAGFEEAIAALGDAERSGAQVVAVHSVAGLASAASLSLLPRALDLVGYGRLVLGLAVVLLVLAALDAHRPTRRPGRTARSG